MSFKNKNKHVKKPGELPWTNDLTVRIRLAETKPSVSS
jgi:hypothetical protein